MTVTYAFDERVAVITLDDGKANALSHEVLDDLAGSLDHAESDDAGAVVLAGRPGRFSAGFDLSVMTAGEDQMRALVTKGARVLNRLFVHPAPVVVACTGHALAAGALLVLTGDVTIGADGDFKIGLNEVAIGMGLPRFAVELARFRLDASGLNAALLGQVHDPVDAGRVGYLDHVVPADAVVGDAIAAARRLAQLRTGAVAHTKQRLRGAIAEEIAATLDADLAEVSGPTP